MAVASPLDVNIQATTLERIESFFGDSQYKEILESSAIYNKNLCNERKLRLPFIDTQTGVAQNHSSLFLDKRQRLPGILPGQIYSYPRQRWRKKRRQYLTMNSRVFARAADAMLDGDTDMHNISQIENPALQDTDSKDSQLLYKDEVSKEWFYDEQEMLEMDAYDEPDPDSDLDYEESYSKRSKRRKGAGRGRGTDSPSTPGRKKGPGRGRKKAGHSFEPTPGDPDKPFACERTPARRGRPNQSPNVAVPLPPGVAIPPHIQTPPSLPPNLPPIVPPSAAEDPPMPVLVAENPVESTPSSSTMIEPTVRDNKAAPSPYCDFCLGDSRENKKTGGSEELVSCADCGRSGKNGEVAVKVPAKKGRKKKVL